MLKDWYQWAMKSYHFYTHVLRLALWKAATLLCHAFYYMIHNGDISQCFSVPKQC